ncbi:hypothetical protein [Dietzia timorensis]|uniref:Uncharacterized protein n=1 Tax=Dietzia timorensis TaxID=499555 RepID=A0A173LK68_9ACTN|nr:hypothetical protein [Dietzia timorensis]ANI91677.1 Hypothetical protein BJL86_0883 [Dietzia timorensis]
MSTTLPDHLRAAALGLGHYIEGSGDRFELRDVETGERFEHAGQHAYTPTQPREALHALWQTQR